MRKETEKGKEKKRTDEGRERGWMVVVGGKKDWKAEGPEKVRVDSVGGEQRPRRLPRPDGVAPTRGSPVVRRRGGVPSQPAYELVREWELRKCGNAEMRKCEWRLAGVFVTRCDRFVSLTTASSSSSIPR